MNKDEMIEDIRAIIDDRCEAELGQVHAVSKGGKVTKTVSTSLIAKDIYNAGFCKIADDEIVIKTSATDCCDEKVIAFFEEHNAKVRKETAREILQEIQQMDGFSCDYDIDDIVLKIANKYGIELEE